MCYYYLIVFVLGGFGAQTGGASTLPVIIADHDRTVAHLDFPPNPLHALTVNDFSYIVREATRHSEIILIFVEKKFRMEDVSIKDKYGSPFFHLEEMLCAHKLKFLPAVANPYDTLTKIMPQLLLGVFHVTSKTKKLQFFGQKYKYYYIFFQDYMNTTRAQALREHDRIIEEVYSAVRQLTAGPVVAFYTGMAHPSAALERKQVVEDRFLDYNRTTKLSETRRMTNKRNLKYKNVIHDPDYHFLFAYGKSLCGPFDGCEKVAATTGMTESVTSNVIGNTLIANWIWEDIASPNDRETVTFTFTFTLEDDGWIFTQQKITITGGTTPISCVFDSQPSNLTQYNNSFVCDVSISCEMPPSTKIIFYQYQVQVSTERLTGFDPPVSCRPVEEYDSYITPGIASGLVVCLVWVGLMTIGIVMMLSISRYDKFDNAQGVQLLFSES